MNKGYLFILVAVLLWAISSGILVKLATISPLPFFTIGAFFGGLSALFLAFSCTIEKKLAVTTTNPLVPVFYKNLIPFLVFLPFSWSTIQHGISLQNWLVTAIWGILVLGVSFISYFKSLQLIPVSHASIIAYGEPVGAIILAFLFFHQPINGYIFFGGIVILISGIILIKTGNQSENGY